jgi:hypothetical protein
MRKTFLATVAMLALTAPASAFDLTITNAPYFKFTPGASARIINIPPPLSEAERAMHIEQDRLWLAYCQPRRNVDEFGVTRLSYAQPGCEFGRTE